MVGADVHQISSRPVDASGPVLLSVDKLSAPADGPFGVALQSINLAVRAGEVVAIAGIAGNGQSELFDCLSGERKSDPDKSIRIDNQSCGGLGVTARRRLGAAFVPEERLGHGAVPSLTLSENVLLTRHASDPSLVHAGWVNRRQSRAISELIVGQFDVRSSAHNPQASALSGGNLQKFVIGRELDRKPKLVVINQPTWGVDAGAAALIRQALVDLARAGAAVLVISQDLDEIFDIADRIAVISRGRLSPAERAADTDLERVGLLMAGGLASTPHASASPSCA
jgi:simple sugar transport system ATP-binding protein